MAGKNNGKIVPVGGFLMALADSVPGVSGGTVAFIVGIYDELLKSLNAILSGTHKQRKCAALFLVKLLAGWVVGMVSAVLVLTSLFESHIYIVSSVFLGFIVFSIPIIIREERMYLKGRYVNLVWTVIGVGVVAALTLSNGTTEAGPIVSLIPLDPLRAVTIFVAAAVAVSAMILPGISGSTFLLIFGLYLPIMNALRGLLAGDMSELPIAVVFAIGAIIGLVTVIKLVKRALDNFRSQTIYCILGLMAGSMIAIAMGPTTLSVPLPPLSFETFNIAGFIGGGIIIALLEGLKRLLSK